MRLSALPLLLTLASCPPPAEQRVVQAQRGTMDTLFDAGTSESEALTEPEGGEVETRSPRTLKDSLTIGDGSSDPAVPLEPVPALPSAAPRCDVVGGSIPGLNEACGGVPPLSRQAGPQVHRVVPPSGHDGLLDLMK